MADVPLVSVVIPLFNKDPYIARALNSVLAQTFQDFEVIVVDDGSTDDGAEVVRGFDDPRIRLIQQENQGVSAARNRGIEAARAELVAFLDADDEWLPEFLETILNLKNAYPNAGLYASAYLVKTNTGKVINSRLRGLPFLFREGLLPRYFHTATLSPDPIICTSSVLLPKKAFGRQGGFKKGVGFGEDTDLWGRIALERSIAYTITLGAIYHREAENRACNIEKMPAMEAIVGSLEKHLLKNNDSKTNKRDVKEYIARKKIEAAKRNIMVEDYDKARNILYPCKTRRYWLKKYIMIAVVSLPKDVIFILKNICLQIFYR